MSTKKAEDIAGFKATTNLSDVKKKLKPGDIIITSMGRPVTEGPVLDVAKDKLWRYFSRSVNKDHAHTGIYVGKGHVVEMLNDRLAKRPLDKTVDGLDAVVVRPQVDPNLRRTAVSKSIALAEKGDKFKYGDLPFFAKVYLADKINLKPSTDLNKRIDQNQVMCSNFIAHAYQGVKFHPEKIRAVITPNDLATSDKTKRVVLFQNPGRHDPENRPKLSAVEKGIFAGFAKDVLEEVQKEEKGEIEENDPVSPYRDSQLSRAMYTEKNRTPNADKPPRAESARQPMYTKSASLASAATRGLAGFNRQRFQDQLASRLEPKKDVELEDLDITIRRPDSIIPGSTYLRPGRHGHAGTSHSVKSFLMKKQDLDKVDDMFPLLMPSDRGITGE